MGQTIKKNTAIILQCVFHLVMWFMKDSITILLHLHLPKNYIFISCLKSFFLFFFLEWGWVYTYTHTHMHFKNRKQVTSRWLEPSVIHLITSIPTCCQQKKKLACFCIFSISTLLHREFCVNMCFRPRTSTWRFCLARWETTFKSWKTQSQSPRKSGKNLK